MAISRKVLRTGKDRDNEIRRLCGDGFSVTKADAITQIEGGSYRYYVIVNYAEVDVRVVKGSHGKYLRTDPDKTPKNNLQELPDC